MYIKNPKDGAVIDKFVRDSVRYVHPVGTIRLYEDATVAKDICGTYKFLEDVSEEVAKMSEKERKEIAKITINPSKRPIINHEVIKRNNLLLRLKAGEYTDRGLTGRGVEQDLIG